MSKLNLSAPWVEYYHAVEAMFKADPEISVVYDDEGKELKLYVDNAVKADSLAKLLPAEKSFGNVALKISVIPSNNEEVGDLLHNVFADNPYFSRTVRVDGIMSNPLTYVVFEPEATQYWVDNLGDINGNRTILYEDLAKEVFEDLRGVFFCSEEIPS